MQTLLKKIGFVLQLGYFRAVNKFYKNRKFHKKDIEYVARNLSIDHSLINFLDYKSSTSQRHQKIILSETGFNKFTSETKKNLIVEVELLASRQQKPRLIFMSLVDFLQTNKTQVPNYNTFADIITESLKNYENRLVQTINDLLTEDEKDLIDDLLEKDSKSAAYKYTLTALKNHNHSIRAGKIKDNLNDFEYLEELFVKILPVLQTLNLTPKMIKYYADIVFVFL